MRKLFKSKMIYDPEVFIKEIISKNKRRHHFFKHIHFILNLLIILGAFVLVVVSALLVSKLIWKGFPTWYYYLTSAMSALATFTTLIINLFVIDKKISKFKRINLNINIELALYDNSKGKYKIKSNKMKKYILFMSTINILEYKMAIEEGKI